MCDLSTLSTDTTSKLNILRHDCHALSVNSTKICVFKKSNKISLGCFLERKDSSGLESQIGLEVLSDLTHETLEGGFADEKISGFLVFTNLTERNSSRAVSVRLLYSSSGGRGLACSLGCKLLAGCLASGGLAGSLLGSGHVVFCLR